MMISGLPSVVYTQFCPPRAATARNKATSLCGRSAGCHISPQHLKKIIPAPHDSAPSGYTATTTHCKQRRVSKRGGSATARCHKSKQMLSRSPAIIFPPLKSKGRTDPLTALDRSDSCKINRSLRLQLRLKSCSSSTSSSPTAHGRRPPTGNRTHAAAGGEQRHCPTSCISFYMCIHVCTNTVIYVAAIVAFTNPLIGI